jgi:hypothetical protein
MGRTARTVAGASIVLAPLLVGVGDQLRMRADPPDGVGIVQEFGAAEAAQSLANIDANHGMFLAAAFLVYAATVLAIPALVAIWRLSVARAPRWAWAGAAMATAYVFGGAGKLGGFNTMASLLAPHYDTSVAAEVWLATDSHPLVIALFLPYLLGLLAVIPQAIGLRRARVIPLWACLSVVTGAVLFIVLGSTSWVTGVWTVLLVAGFTPAALALVRGDEATVGPETAPTTA